LVHEVPRTQRWILPAFGAAAGLLLGSWLHPPTREWWDALDATFRLLNDSLAAPHTGPLDRQAG
jgi:hypothetical protein